MSKDNQDKMMLLLDEAYAEGVQSMVPTVKKAEDDAYERGREKGYTEGYGDALKALPVSPTTEEQAEGGVPVHCIDSLSISRFFNDLTPDGYSERDYSKIWPTLLSTDVDSGKAEMNYPYVIHGKGDKVLVVCDDEPTQTILPYKETFAIYCLTPGKTYRWTMMSGTKVLSDGSFNVVGRVRWMKTPNVKYPHNMRDIGFPKELASQGNGMKFGRIYRGEHPDNIAVGSAEHLYLRDQLGITVQLNLRDEKDDPARTDLFDKTYSYNIPAYATILTADSTKKARFKNAFHALVTELNAGHNVLVNCWQGRDRTGTFCWFLQALCYMFAGYLQGSWEASSYDRCENSMIWEEGHSEGKLLQMVSKFNAKWGVNPYEQALGLAKLVGITDKDIQDFQKAMLA